MIQIRANTKGDNIKKNLFSNIYLENSHYYNTMQVRINLKTNYKNINYRQQTYLLCKIARNTLVPLQITFYVRIFQTNVVSAAFL